MVRISEYPIKKKLTLMNIFVTGSALSLACGAFVVYSVSTFRGVTLRNLSAQARIISSNTVSAVVFHDPDSAETTLSALQATPNIVFALIYSPDGSLFAKYVRQSDKSIVLPTQSPAQTETSTFTINELTLGRPILFNQTTRGFLYIRSDLREMNALLLEYALIGALVLVAAVVIAYFISAKFQRYVAEPLMGLAETAQIISREKKYLIRATTTSTHDEVGILIRAFNQMLDNLQERDTALHNAQERLTLSLKSAGMGTWNWDLLTNEFVWDDFVHPLFGLQAGVFDRTYDHFETLLHPDDRKRIAQEVSWSIQRNLPLDCQFRVVWPGDGSIHILAARGQVYRDDAGRPLHLTGVFWDVTELKRAEQEILRLNQELENRVQQRTLELEATNKELEAFTYSVAHDLRSPLRHIHGFSKLLQEQCRAKLDDDDKELLSDILEGSENMGRLIDDLLALGRVGRQELKRQTTGLNSLVDVALRDLKTDIRDREIQWEIEQLPFIDCDPGLMRQVLSNLLGNAVKYTRPRKPARIHVGHYTNGERVIFVRDNGVGFDSKYAEKLFGVFQRLHRKEDFEGTGVGLATVQRILHKHGGRIWAEAELDKGATFYFTIPSVDENREERTTLSKSVRTA